jgi:hypothetical protein
VAGALAAGSVSGPLGVIVTVPELGIEVGFQGKNSSFPLNSLKVPRVVSWSSSSSTPPESLVAHVSAAPTTSAPSCSTSGANLGSMNAGPSFGQKGAAAAGWTFPAKPLTASRAPHRKRAAREATVTKGPFRKACGARLSESNSNSPLLNK